jgi:hypothetical protein
MFLMPFIKIEANCSQSILRVKNALKHLRDKIVEFPINQIYYIHEVPNPRRTDHPPNFLDELTEKIRRQGFQELYAVPLMLMPDGKVYCMGHHRTEVMKRLGETTIPAYIYEWDSLSAESQRKAIQEFPEITRHIVQTSF